MTEQLVGVIERITFYSDESGYTVLKLQVPRCRDLICCVGKTSGLQPGETVRCKGEWSNHVVHGRQFAIETYETEQPADEYGIRKYLGSGLVKGIGPVMAERIVDLFGTETLSIIDNQPELLKKVSGIGKKRVDLIAACWEEQRAVRDVMIFLRQYDISPAFAQKIYKKFGAESIEKVRTNPYCLARDIRGIGFRSADKIAQAMGIEKESSSRIEAGAEYTLSQLADDGHVCYPLDDLIELTATELEVKSTLIPPILTALEQERRVVIDSINALEYIWIRPLHLAESGISREIKRLQESEVRLRDVDSERALEWVQKELRIELAKNQAAAVSQALREKTQIITGGPGTGKSTITRAILAILSKLTDQILLAAPTGRAAKRMHEITYWRASTIHSLLEFSFQEGGFKRNRQNPLECDLLIIDEASMIDTLLMYHLLRAIPSHARVIFVGDINQLPSVGPGNVLRDLIASDQLAVTQLNEIFRQARGSQIVVNAHKINSGEFPFLNNKPDSDFFFIEAQEPEEVRSQIVSLVSERLPKKYGFDPISDIQVLAPMRKGVVGTNNLNEILQSTLNPSQEDSVQKYGQYYFPGDKVMQIRNNYTKEVANGDVGRILSVDTVEQQVLVLFEGREVSYELSELDELVLAYAVSIHKYQGSECPCVVMPVHTTHFKLLHRNLLYTGITRGKKLVVLVGTKKAVAIAVNTDDVRKRYTGLKEALVK